MASIYKKGNVWYLSVTSGKNRITRSLKTGDTKGESRVRTYTAAELKLMFAEITDESFNAFVRFAYYTGARSGEIRRIPRENVLVRSI